jgi:hypothetical protein
MSHLKDNSGKPEFLRAEVFQIVTIYLFQNMDVAKATERLLKLAVSSITVFLF